MLLSLFYEATFLHAKRPDSFAEHYWRNYVYIFYYFKKQSKAIHLQAWGGPEGFRKLRFPDFMTTAQDDGKVARPPLPAGNTPGTHFC